jgi:virulence factor Mce-like protein
MDRTAGEAPFREGDAQAAFEAGERMAERGDLEGAEQAYRRADEGGHPTAAAYAGVFDEARGHTRAAEQAYQRADERGVGFGAFRLGLLLSRAGDWEAARSAWARADERGEAQPPFDPAALLRGQTDRGMAGPRAGVPRSAFASPVLIGAVTVLIAIVAVFLAYNANTGLPFVPTRQLKVDIVNGAQLVAGNDVDEGGLRVGLISELKPVELPSGQIGAQLTLQLSRSNGKIPVDSTATIRPRSVLGLKYLNILPGRSRKTFSDGATMPISQTNVPVQFEDINTLFDAKTRPAVQRDLAGYGDALTARGSALNDTIASLPSLFGHLQPVAQYLSDPNTQLTRFLVALNGFMGTVSPVAHVNAELFKDQATTFEAISRNASDLANTIRESPSTLDVSTASLKVQQPFLVDLTTFSNYLAPATSQLEQALPNINPALAAGIKVLPRTPSMNQKLEGVLGALKSLALDPGTNVALNGLTATVGTLNPTVRYLGPYVTVCNDWNIFWAELADLVSEQTSFGMAQRALIMFGNHQANSVANWGATSKANGYQPGDVPDAGFPGDAEYNHGAVYSAAVANNGKSDCETGQWGYAAKLNHLDPQGRSLQLDAHVPANQGPTFSGLSRVPPGETYSRNPSTGPQLPYIPSNP